MKEVKNTIFGQDLAVPVVIAEVGINHNGDLETAKKMIKTAFDNGAGLVKLQSFQPAKFLSPNVPYYEEIEKLAFTFEEQEELFRFSKKIGASLFSTPFDDETVDFLDSMNVPAFKVASMDMNNIPLLRAIGRKKKPVFLATGMAETGEIENAVETIRKEGNNDIILMHCVSDYPADPSSINLDAMIAIAEKFSLPAGFSDHSIGINASIIAATLGAKVIEKHFTLDRGMKELFPYSDHAISIEPEELKALTIFCRLLPVMMGEKNKKLSYHESRNREKFRRGIYAASDIRKGEVLASDNLIPLRPSDGVSVSVWDTVIGKRASRDIAKWEALKPDLIDDFIP